MAHSPRITVRLSPAQVELLEWLSGQLGEQPAVTARQMLSDGMATRLEEPQLAAAWKRRRPAQLGTLVNRADLAAEDEAYRLAQVAGHLDDIAGVIETDRPALANALRRQAGTLVPRQLALDAGAIEGLGATGLVGTASGRRALEGAGLLAPAPVGGAEG
jgi:hypothetical protein